MTDFEIIELFCLVDDFTIRFETMVSKKQIGYQKRRIRNRKSRTTLSEVMTILLLFHRSNYRTFKHFYLHHVKKTLLYFFPNLVGYSRFIQMIKEAIVPMFCFCHEHLGKKQGIYFIDSTSLTACHLKRAYSHQTFKKEAKWGKTSTGWFFGFKLHLVINHHSEIVSFMLTPGNCDDRTPVPELLKNIQGKCFGDRGYVSKKLFVKLYAQGVSLITRMKKKMKNTCMSFIDKILLRKRGLIESVNNLLKNQCQIEHHRHRSKLNFLGHLFSGLTTYNLNPNKPRLFFPKNDIQKILALNSAS